MVVVGAGPVGVELAGEVVHYFREKRVLLVCGADTTVCPTMPAANARFAGLLATQDRSNALFPSSLFKRHMLTLPVFSYTTLHLLV